MDLTGSQLVFAAGCKLIHFRQLRCRGWWFRALRGAFVAFLNFVNKGRAVDAIVQLMVFFERESGDAKSLEKTQEEPARADHGLGLAAD